MAAIIDHRLKVAGIYFLVASVCSLFGIIHSPFADERLVLPWNLGAELPHAAAGQTPFYLAISYLLVAVMLFVWGKFLDQHEAEETPEC